MTFQLILKLDSSAFNLKDIYCLSLAVWVWCDLLKVCRHWIGYVIVGYLGLAELIEMAVG